MPKALTNIDITHISLVDRGANQRQIIWKAAGETDAAERLRHAEVRKVDDEKRMVYGVVYAPDDEDTDGDQATAAEIEKAAHRFMKAARTQNVDQQHDLVVDEGFVAESYIVRKGDAHFPDDVGAWAVGIKVEDEETWEQVKKGEIAGISMYGTATKTDVEKRRDREPASDDRNLIKKGWDALRKAFGGEVRKDFQSEYQRSQLRTAVDALVYSLDDVLFDYHETFGQKKAALLSEAQAFTILLNEMEASAMAKSDDRTDTQKLTAAVEKLTERLEKAEAGVPNDSEDPAPEKSSAEDPAATGGAEKEGGAQTEQQAEEAEGTVEKLAKTVEALTERVDEIAGSSSGRQSSDGRESVEKGDGGGLNFLG